MKYLLHCVFRQGASAPSICGVSIAEEQGLAAALTAWEGATPVGIARLVAFEKIIAAFHQARTIIPFRFGCLLDSMAQARSLLAEHRQRFERLLERVDGRVEMSLRVLRQGAVVPDATALAAPPTRGAQYLAAARRRHAGLDARGNLWDGKLCHSLAGCYTGMSREAGQTSAGRIISLHFLVPRSAAADFRARAKAFPAPPGTKLLISGPWPPYNFVQ